MEYTLGLSLKNKESLRIERNEVGDLDKSSVYQVIDGVRFISICSIIWGHCLLGWQNREFTGFQDNFIYSCVLQLGKLGTINFFLISGFLLADKLNVYSVSSYFKKRLRSTYLPFLFFIYVFAVYKLRLGVEFLADGDYSGALHHVYVILVGTLFYSSYWFIPVFFISTSVIIAFKQFVFKAWFGIVLALISLAYCMNLHEHWFEVSHTKALFGYTFFIWLGVYINRHICRLTIFLEQLSWTAITAVLLATFCLACYEGHVLLEQGSIDPFSSLRFSNALFGITFFLVLVKFGRINFLKRFNPQKNVFAIFLIQNILVFELMAYLNPYADKAFAAFDLKILLLIQCVFFVIIFNVNYFLAAKLTSSPFSWLAGKANKKTKEFNPSAKMGNKKLKPELPSKIYLN